VLRLRGIYLALATLAFAYAMDNMFFNKELGVGGILRVGRFGPQSQRMFLVEVAVLFACCAVGALALKRGEFGRRLAAVNDSELACASLGMNITTTKVVAFTLAAGIAGLGGALLGGWQGQVGPNDFPMLFSLIVLLLIAVGGLGSVGGAFAAAMAYALQPTIQQHAPWHIANFPQLLVGVAAVSLGRNPAGLAGHAADAAEWLRARRASLAERDSHGSEELGVVRVAG
jgi:branched-chain amino acid transport system permease protein